MGDHPADDGAADGAGLATGALDGLADGAGDGLADGDGSGSSPRLPGGPGRRSASLPVVSVADALATDRQHVLDLVGAPLTPSRMKCALLGLKVMKTGLANWRLARGESSGLA